MNKVLIVDSDSTADINPVLLALQNKGLEFKRITLSDDVKGTAQEFRPDIMFIHASTEGFDVCKEIKSDYRTCHIKFFVMAETTNLENVVEGFCLGAIDYIPLNTPEEDIIRYLEINSSIEAMYDCVRDYSATMHDIQLSNRERVAESRKNLMS